MKKLRIYLDTCVVGGCLEEEFAGDSLRLFEAARNGRLVLLAGETLVRELRPAPPEVRAIFESLPPEAVELIPLTEETLTLRDAYIAAGIVGTRWRDDATQVAAATVARADAIVSWNFRHLVRLDKMKAYNLVNVLNGYGPVTIITPREVRLDESDKD